MVEVCPAKRTVALVAGAVAGWAVEEGARRTFRSGRVELAALGLVTAAAIYPAARRGGYLSLAAAREAAAVAATAGLAVVGCRWGPGPQRAGFRRALIALGWVGHALFDAKHRAGPEGRLPAWYPDLCAGYDVAFAAALLRP
jgi:hypothetical protein